MTLLPDFASATFKPGAAINNQFFPLKPGTVLAYIGTDSSGEAVEANDTFATSLTRLVDGVEAMVVRDTGYEDGQLSEETLDYYAQDKQGNVWYLGETVINYEYDDDGNFVGTNSEGAWLAGVDGALPGWIMAARPTLGLSYFNEFSPGVATDESEIVALRQHIRTDFGQFPALETRDTSSVEPGIVEFKYYGPGIGIVREEEDLDAQGVPGLVNDLSQIVKMGDSHLPQGADAVDAAQFVSDGGPLVVTIVSEDSEFDNSLGYYTFDPATGEIGEGRVIFDGGTGSAGDTITIAVPDGEGVGFFLVPDSGELGIDLSVFAEGGLFFTNMLNGEQARLSDGMAPIITDEDGQPLPIPVFHALGAAHASDLLNPGIGIEGVEWDVGKSGDAGLTLLGFEDQRLTSDDYDGDFNDLMIAVGDHTANPADYGGVGGASLEVLGQPLADHIA